MNMIFRLSLSKLRYHKSRTLLTGIAVMLTTTLLMAVGTSAVATFDMNRQIAQSYSNYHAAFHLTDPKQLSVLSNHIHVEALELREAFAKLINGKMDGSLVYREVVKDGIYIANDQLSEGHYPEKEDEICSLPAFFERVGAEPVVGGKVTLSFRVNGKGEIQTKEFTICGLLRDRQLSSDISDVRLSWSAYISKPFIDAYSKTVSYEPEYTADLRFYGEDYLDYDEMMDRINGTAADIGLAEDHIIYNKGYLATITDSSAEAMGIVAGISLVIILFSTLVIYSIFYVGVISDIQEIGKLKALGVSRRQTARLFFCQGGIISAFAVPAGALLGYLLVRLLFPLVIQGYGSSALESSMNDTLEKIDGRIHMFSLPVLLIVTVAVLITVCLSLLKPIRMAKKISPVEAIRYQESTASHKNRRGHRELRVSTLTLANLSRNRKRTIVTLLTMGLSCVLFICVSAVLSSMRAEDLARRTIEKGDFRISLNYSTHDREYPENNLDSLVQQEYFSEAFLAQLAAIEGVEQVERCPGKILTSCGTPTLLYEENDNRRTISYFTREDIPALQEALALGDIDYDRMTANQEIICTHVYTFEQDQLSLGDVFPLTLYDGDRQIPFTATLTALTESPFIPVLCMTEDTWKNLGLVYDPTTDIYLHVQEARYDSVKESLQTLAAQNPYFLLYSMDEEMRIGRYSVNLIKYPVYLLLVLIAVISFMNLINTMITSVISRKRELGILQAVGLSNKQLARMLSGEGLIFTAGTLFISMTLGNLFGYLLFLYAKEKDMMSLHQYHYPVWESVGLMLLLLTGQTVITLFINKRVAHESLIERIRSQE